MILTQKNLIIDVDNSIALANTSSSAKSDIVIYRNSVFTFKAQLYQCWDSTNVYPLATTDKYCVFIGDTYGANAAPVITESNAIAFNQTADWSEVNPTTGKICFTINTTSSILTTDLANVVSKEYTLQVWLNNDLDNGVLLINHPIIIKNVAVDPI